jgi:hypothetical protein
MAYEGDELHVPPGEAVLRGDPFAAVVDYPIPKA